MPNWLTTTPAAVMTVALPHDARHPLAPGLVAVDRAPLFGELFGAIGKADIQVAACNFKLPLAEVFAADFSRRSANRDATAGLLRPRTTAPIILDDHIGAACDEAQSRNPDSSPYHVHALAPGSFRAVAVGRASGRTPIVPIAG